MLAVAVAFSACKKDTIEPDDPADEMVLVGSGSDNGLTIEVYAEDSLILGYNELFVRLSQDNTEIGEGDYKINLAPMMDMGSMKHAAPVEHPVNQNDHGFFEGAAVFIMPNGQSNWTLDVTAEEIGGSNTSTVHLNPAVTTPEESRMHTFESDIDQTALFVSLVEPRNPQTGINDFEITIHKREDMMTHPPVVDYEVVIEPEMPTMGHGSSNNVDPVHESSGHYHGEVNFTMSGYWQVHLTLLQGTDTVKRDIAFDITF